MPVANRLSSFIYAFVLCRCKHCHESNWKLKIIYYIFYILYIYMVYISLVSEVCCYVNLDQRQHTFMEQPVPATLNAASLDNSISIFFFPYC